MNEADRQRVQQFLSKWLGSQGSERGNDKSFLGDWCIALGVEPPHPKGSIPGDPYCFEKDIKFVHSDRDDTTSRADCYKAGHFLIEAKQGSDGSTSSTAPKRGTSGYERYLQKAFFQGRAYIKQLAPTKLPFLLTCDIGSHFELWTDFTGQFAAGYGARERIDLTDFLKPEVFDRFVAIFNDPQSLNPEKYRAKVTREVADTLAKLARWLEEQGHEPQEASNFLMRCIFTMFAEDVDLLQGEVFTKALKERWLADPTTFKPQIEALWQTMNTGGSFGFERILRFNGSFFADATAFELPKAQLEILHEAASKDWSAVEPAIFGTLLERALDKKERSRLGAHYTPRSYVERLVRPVVMEPLREEWLLVESEVDRLLMLKDGQQEPTKAQRQKAAIEIQAFLDKLQQIRILDPACGTGNFLYVTLDLLKTLEQEVQTRLLDVVGQVTTDLLEEFDPRLAGRKQVNPSQFLGIEINPRAAAIAELVIWIGYLQWHFKRSGSTPPPEPILQDFQNIRYGDALLEDGEKEEAIDPKTGQVKTRWGGRMMKHPVTGEDVPDPSNQIPIYRYIKPRPAEWPEADYIVSNPPFVANSDMRELLGDGYTETVREVYSDVPATVDYVMYWWHKSAEALRKKKLSRFGLITTNTIRQERQRAVIELHQQHKEPVRLFFAIPDHPWAEGDAAVTVAMTGGELDLEVSSSSIPRIGVLSKKGLQEWDINYIETKFITSSLQISLSATDATQLESNRDLAAKGFEPGCLGFTVRESEFSILEQEPIRPFKKLSHLVKGRDLEFVIDVNHVTDENKLMLLYPRIYQHLVDRVKSVRVVNNEQRLREKWWQYRRSNEALRKAISGLSRYIITGRTAKHRCFFFCEIEAHCETEVICIGLDDAFDLGILSSTIHSNWALSARNDLGGNTPRYFHDVCFNTFPFPDPTPEEKQKIRELGERLDAHRKRVQAQHPEVTITKMYDLLEKLRKGEAFTESDRAYNDKALVSTLKQIHDELDAAVFEAYGWQPDLSEEEILDRLVALNADRAEEERNGFVRWLRPDYQAPNEVTTQQVLAGIVEPEEIAIAPIEQKVFPKQPKEQLAAIRDLLRTNGGEWSIEQIAAQFKSGGRYKGAIAENLERLEWFGIVFQRTDETGKTYWEFADSSTQAA